MRRVAPWVIALTLCGATRARAQEAQPDPDAATAPVELAPAATPRYVLDGFEVRGNTETRASVIEHALLVSPGEVIAADDPRLDASRFRVLGLGFFEDVRLALRKGTVRGHVVLVVEVVERGTIILNEIFLGSSEATPFWAGLDLGENNFLGHGVSVSGAFVAAARADVPGAVAQEGFRLRLWDPDVRGFRVGLGGELLLSHGSEFFRALGPDDASTPADFVALEYRRVGGGMAGGFDLGTIAHVRIAHRAEWIDATLPAVRARTLPDGGLAAIPFDIRPGTSILSAFDVSVEFDTRSDPVLPEHGFRLALDGQLSTALWGSDYEYGKLSLAYDHYGRMPFGHHVLAVRLLGGVIVGDAPFFEQFFIGDLNRLLAPRALGLNFSTQPSRSLLGLDAIREQRYDPIAGRAALEYIIPLWRSHRLVYAGEFFAMGGVFALTSFDQLRARDRSLGDALPFDLTFDVGVRLDTTIGIFTLSVANLIGRIPL
jgi:outer membrane protein assembly factor BamA